MYGLHQILSQQKSIDYIIIVEGYMDVIALAQHEIMNAVATLGTATSTYHIQLLAKHTKSLIFASMEIMQENKLHGEDWKAAYLI